MRKELALPRLTVILAMLVLATFCKKSDDAAKPAAAAAPQAAVPASEPDKAGVQPAAGETAEKKATVVGVVAEDFDLAGAPTAVSSGFLTLAADDVVISRLDASGAWAVVETDAAIETRRLRVHLAEGAYLIYWELASGRIVRGFALVSPAAAASGLELIVRLGVTNEFAAKVLETLPGVAGGAALLGSGDASESILAQLGAALAHAGATFDPAAIEAVAAALVQATTTALAADVGAYRAALGTRPSPDELQDVAGRDWTLFGRDAALDLLLDAIIEGLAATVPDLARGAAVAATAAHIELNGDKLAALRTAFAAIGAKEALVVIRNEDQLADSAAKVDELIASGASPDELAAQLVAVATATSGPTTPSPTPDPGPSTEPPAPAPAQPPAQPPAPPVVGTAPPSLLDVRANGSGLLGPAVTYSRILLLELTFQGPVTVLPGAFGLTNGASHLSSAEGGAIAVGGSGTSTLTLTFSGASGVDFRSLADGIWTLTSDLSKLKNAASEAGVGSVTTADIRRLFGDIDANGVVNSDDFDQFGNASGSSAGDAGFVVGFDFDDNATIDGTDFSEFGNRNGLAL